MSLRQRENPIRSQSSMRRHTNIRKHVFCTRFQDQKPISPEWPHPSDGSLSTQSTKLISTEWPYPSDGSLSSSPFHLNGHTPQTEVFTNIETEAYVMHNQLHQHRNGSPQPAPSTSKRGLTAPHTIDQRAPLIAVFSDTRPCAPRPR